MQESLVSWSRSTGRGGMYDFVVSGSLAEGVRKQTGDSGIRGLRWHAFVVPLILVEVVGQHSCHARNGRTQRLRPNDFVGCPLRRFAEVVWHHRSGSWRLHEFIISLISA